jgi:DNA-directed RNA polymerase IV and V subunit 2
MIRLQVGSMLIRQKLVNITEHFLSRNGMRFILLTNVFLMILHRLLAAGACAMEELPKDGVQSLSGSDSELEPMQVDNNGAEEQSPVDADKGQSSMDVDMKGKSTLAADTKGKPSLEPHTQVPIEMSVESLEKFCREASRSFFNEIGLISHQINSYNEFISRGLQELFDSLGEVVVEPGYDPSKKGPGSWKHATIKFGRVKLEKPVFWSGKDETDINFKPRHARLQNMTYASKMKVQVTIQVLNIFCSNIIYVLSMS